MDRSVIACDEARRKLVEMGFESSIVSEAVKEVGPSLDEAVDFILNERRSRDSASSSGKSSTSSVKAMGKRKAGSFQCPGKMRQTSILDHLKSRVGGKKTKTIPQIEVSPCFSEELKIASSHVGIGEKKARHFPSSCSGEDAGVAWEQKVCNIMHKHFGFSSLKSFQKEALAAWFGNQDCLVLAATGSGKSLCFQIPALFSRKIVVVISPLISLMHDQCLKLSRCGVSACFLGSGQPDSSVEQKAMSGRYNIIYVCPETVLRLIKPLQKLAETHGIALFAIDEVHCVSKWGHDFRPDYRYSKTCAAMQYFRQRLYSVMPLLACSKNERRLAVLRENFSTSNLKFLKFDVPIMALTATATIRVRNDILTSLCMSKKTQIVVTSFFRPNLCFSVKHSKTSSPSSYEKDFQGLINTYTKNKPTYKNYSKNSLEEHLFDGFSDTNGNISEDDGTSSSDIDEDDNIFIGNDNLLKQNGSTSSKEKCMSVEYLEDETEELLVNDWDVLFGEFHGQHSSEDGNWDVLPPKAADPLMQPEERQKLIHEPLEHGPTIIYVPTRKETLSIAKFLSRFGIKAAAYNAKLPKSHLRQVHKEFHENAVEVIVATIAFGMGIDKLNVRRIIHYGWPQSLEAYYQEAGRAGRDGKLAECVLYVNLSRVPTLLPSRRSDEQTKQAYKMLSDCFRYGVNTSVCRAKILVDYFGEESCFGKCLVCDICVNGPPEMQNFKEEACAFIEVVASHYVAADCFCEDVTYTAIKQKRSMDKLNMRTLISTIREQFHRYTATDQLWWRGLARMLEAKGFISERDDRNYVQIKSPEPTELGLEFLQSKVDLYLYPEADMFLSLRTPKCNSTFSEWGRGWADPKVRHQRLERIRSGRKPKNCKPRKRHQLDPNSARGRIAAKLSKVKKGK